MKKIENKIIERLLIEIIKNVKNDEYLENNKKLYVHKETIENMIFSVKHNESIECLSTLTNEELLDLANEFNVNIDNYYEIELI